MLRQECSMMLTMFIRIHNNTHEIYDIHRIHSRVPSPVWFLLMFLGIPGALAPRMWSLVLLLVGRDFLCIAFAREKLCSVAREGTRTPSTCITSVNLSFIGLLFRYITWNMLPPLLKKCSPPSAGNWVKAYCRVRSHCWVTSIEICEVGVGLNPSQSCECQFGRKYRCRVLSHYRYKLTSPPHARPMICY